MDFLQALICGSDHLFAFVDDSECIGIVLVGGLLELVRVGRWEAYL